MKDLADDHPLKAYVYERIAWNHIDRWRAYKAEKCFMEAARLRSRQLNNSNAKGEADARSMNGRAEVFMFWDRHGAAMSKRFQGRNATDDYAALNVDIRKAINDETNNDRQRVDFYDRRVNTLERSADSWLFSADPSRLTCALLKEDKPAEDDRRALKTASLLLGEAREDLRRLQDRFTAAGSAAFEMRLLCKEVICQTLRGDLEHAAVTLTLAEDQKGKVNGDQYDDHLRLIEESARACLGFAKWLTARSGGNNSSSASSSGQQKLRAIAIQCSSPKYLQTLNRDDLELLLFCSALLVGSEKASEPATEEQGDLDAFIGYVRHAREVSENEALLYLRKYFDIAIPEELRRPRPDCNKLVDWVMEARKGTKVRVSLPASEDARGVLLLHFTKTKGLALLSPDGTRDWQVFALPFGTDSRSDQQKWKLTRELMAAIKALPRPIETWYCDPSNDLQNSSWAWGDAELYRMVEK